MFSQFSHMLNTDHNSCSGRGLEIKSLHSSFAVCNTATPGEKHFVFEMQDFLYELIFNGSYRLHEFYIQIWSLHLTLYELYLPNLRYGVKNSA